MWDIWIGKVPVTALMGILWGLLVVFQLLLCGKAQRLWIRLLPALLCCIPAIACSLLAAVTPGWDSLGHLLLALYFGWLLLGCGVGWGIWYLAILWKKRYISRQKPSQRP